MPFADDGPALRANQVRPAHGVTALGEGLRALGGLARGGMLAVPWRVRLPGIEGAAQGPAPAPAQFLRLLLI